LNAAAPVRELCCKITYECSRLLTKIQDKIVVVMVVVVGEAAVVVAAAEDAAAAGAAAAAAKTCGSVDIAPPFLTSLLDGSE
jgi:hypothetical protein